MNLYDGQGNTIPLESEDIKYNIETRVLGYELPEDVDIQNKYHISTNYANTLVSAIKQWSAEYAGDISKIPLITHTDQHGRLSTDYAKGTFKLISDIVNFDSCSACLNLGDTVTDHWEPDETNEDIWLRNEELEKAYDCLNSIPMNKQINVYGNHDTWKHDPNYERLRPMDLNYLNPYFNNESRLIKQYDNSGNMVIYDYYFNVKYLVIASWDYDYERTSGAGATYQYFMIKPEHWDWIIEQMMEDDFDIIILSHNPLYLRSANAIDPLTGESLAEAHPDLAEGICHKWYFCDYNNLLTARKNKTSGSFTDTFGVLHTYDFSNCKHNLLCGLSGHTHFDALQYINNSLLSLSYDWFNWRTIFFSIIDRKNDKIKIWKVSDDNNIPKIETYEWELLDEPEGSI